MRVTIIHVRPELAMRARDLRRSAGSELVGCRAPREQARMPARAAELAVELARPDCRHRAQRAQPEQVESFELLVVEGKLTRGQRSEESARVFDLHKTAWPRTRRRHSC